MNFISSVALVILGTLIGAFGALSLKLASARNATGNLKMFLSREFILGGLLYFLSTVPFLIAVKFGDVTILYPFVATSYIWVIIVSKFFLSEKINIWKTFGILFIIVGVILTSFGRTS